MVTAQLCSTRFASLCTRWCNCGEALSASVQRNAAETQIAINALARFLERANVLMAVRVSDRDASSARIFCAIDSEDR
jgi:hypothetical protein